MTSANERNCSLCAKYGLKPFTRENLLYYYVPLHGATSYCLLSVNVMNPALVSRLFDKADLTNFLLIHSLVGTSLYIYSRPHLQAFSEKKRVAYSVLSSTLFGLGSVLAWAILRTALPKNDVLSTVLGLTSGMAILKLGTEYFEDCDKQLVKKQ